MVVAMSCGGGGGGGGRDDSETRRGGARQRALFLEDRTQRPGQIKTHLEIGLANLDGSSLKQHFGKDGKISKRQGNEKQQ